jgi:hypothetical protein
MIYFHFSVSNPFVENFSNEDFFCGDWKLFGHKHLSIQINKPDLKSIISFGFSVRDQTQDHKGFDIDFKILGFGFILDFYDNRHVEHYND